MVFYRALSLKRLPKSVAEINGEVPVEEFPSLRKEALRNIQEEVVIPGFRPGKIPEELILSRIGEEGLLGEMAEIALQKSYPEIIRELNLKPAGSPKVVFGKIEKRKAVGFTITVEIFPELTLPDYVKLARETPLPEKSLATDEEVEEVIKHERYRLRHSEFHDTTGEKRHDGPNHPKEEDPLPELTDKEARGLAPVGSVAELKTKVREAVEKEKGRAALGKRRAAILETLIQKTKIELPEALAEEEAALMEKEFSADLSSLGITLEEYAKRTGKNLEDLRKSWRPQAEKRAKLEMILQMIGSKENISADKEDIEKEFVHLRTHHPKANDESLRAYVSKILTKEKTLEFLENLAQTIDL